MITLNLAQYVAAILHTTARYVKDTQRSPTRKWKDKLVAEEEIDQEEETVTEMKDPETTDLEMIDPETTDLEMTDLEMIDPETIDPEMTDPERIDLQEVTDPKDEETDQETTDLVPQI